MIKLAMLVSAVLMSSGSFDEGDTPPPEVPTDGMADFVYLTTGESEFDYLVITTGLATDTTRDDRADGMTVITGTLTAPGTEELEPNPPQTWTWMSGDSLITLSLPWDTPKDVVKALLALKQFQYPPNP